MKRLLSIPFLLLFVNGFTQTGKIHQKECNSIIIKFELEPSTVLLGPVFRQGVNSLAKPGYVVLNILGASCPQDYTKVYVSSIYLSPFSIYSQKKITLTGIVKKVKQVPGYYVCQWPGSKTSPSYILTPIYQNLLSL